MASSTDPEPKITGFAKYYNSSTTQGRANVSNLKIYVLPCGFLKILKIYLNLNFIIFFFYR